MHKFKPKYALIKPIHIQNIVFKQKKTSTIVTSKSTSTIHNYPIEPSVYNSTISIFSSIVNARKERPRSTSLPIK